MYLTNEEDDILSGKYGSGLQYAMQLLVTLGEVFDADKLIPITRAHWGLSGQEGDLYFAERLGEGGAYARVHTTTNPAWDLQLKEQFSVTLNDNEMSLLNRTIAVCNKLRVIKSFSCTPYLETNPPKYGEHVAYSESSATPYINSVYGAMTNRESSVSSLAAGIIGKTPNYGLHLKENRTPTIKVDVYAKMKEPFDFGLFGWHLGQMIEANTIPYISGINIEPSKEGLRDFGAMLNTTNAISLYHIKGITPEAKEYEDNVQSLESVKIDDKDIEKTRKEFSNYHGEINSIFIGCPHSTIEEINLVYRLLDGRKIKDGVYFFIFTSNVIFNILQSNGLVAKLKALGVNVIKDSCIDEPVFKFAEGKIGATNSPKAAYYRARRNQKFTILDIPALVEAGVNGFV